ncbi:MAG: DUF2946 family protein [Burkholderiales bacterium]|nr:DUF2946 family protein [Burkholderiales bacterium]
MRSFRCLPPQLFALLAALCLSVAQPAALAHGWSHDLAGDPSARAHAMQDHAGHDHAGHDHDAHDHAGHGSGDAEDALALCDLCAHYSAVVHVPGVSLAGNLVLPQAALPRAPLDPPARAAFAATPYAARAPPLHLS